jgi:peptidyl-prolyl cis-trans isomerase C
MKIQNIISKLATLSIIVVLTGCSDSDYIAKVDGQGITKQVFDLYLAEKRIPVTNSKRLDSALDSYLEREALTNAIESSELLDTAALELEIREIKKQMLISRYFDQHLKSSIDEEAIRNFYAAHAEDYTLKRVHVAHILLRTRSSMDESEIAAVSTKAHEIHSKATSTETFADLAKEHSEDKVSSIKGGDLGWLNDGAVDTLFIKTAFELKQDEVSSVIKTPFGFHIIKSIELPDTIQKSFEAVKGDIRYQLRAEAKKVEFKRLLSTVSIEKISND